MTGLAETSCPSCGGRDMEFRDGRLRCLTCGWTPSVVWLAGELGWRAAAYRAVTVALEEALGQGGSPIEAMRCEQQRIGLAIEMADLQTLSSALVPV